MLVKYDTRRPGTSRATWDCVTLCGNQYMICSRDIPFLVFFRRTIEVKLQTIFLHTINVIEGDGDRFVRKRLNAFGNRRADWVASMMGAAKRMMAATLTTTANMVTRLSSEVQRGTGPQR